MQIRLSDMAFIFCQTKKKNTVKQCCHGKGEMKILTLCWGKNWNNLPQNKLTMFQKNF